MKMKWMVLTLAILAVALVPAAYADCGCENAKAEETVTAEASSCGGGEKAHAGCDLCVSATVDGQFQLDLSFGECLKLPLQEKGGQPTPLPNTLTEQFKNWFWFLH